MKEIWEMTPLELFEVAAQGDRMAIGRLLSMVENRTAGTQELMQQKIQLSHNSCVIGLTGAPGAGKSSLIGSLLGVWKNLGKKIAILAVDPTSPFSGGAVLGDRVRMLNHSQDKNVFIRSLGTRGHMGGLSACIAEAVEILIAMGIDIILVETSGAGQVDVEVAEVTDTTIVMLVPGWGDSMQVAKAGILEIADIYVINKMDQPGADTAATDIELMLDYRSTNDWLPKIMKTRGDTGQGVNELWQGILEHQAYLVDSGEKEKRRQHHIGYLIRRMAIAQLSSTWDKNILKDLSKQVMIKEINFAEATNKVIEVLQNYNPEWAE